MTDVDKQTPSAKVCKFKAGLDGDQQLQIGTVSTKTKDGWGHGVSRFSMKKKGSKTDSVASDAASQTSSAATPSGVEPEAIPNKIVTGSTQTTGMYCFYSGYCVLPKLTDEQSANTRTLGM